MKKARAIVLFSGGLDSRLVIKLLQEQKIEIIAVMFKLPFGGGCCNDEMCSFKFSQLNNINLNIIDCTKGKLLHEYINMIKKPKHGYGSGINPCIDCHLFMLKKAKQIMKKEKADFICTGEVLGERPKSQHKKALELIEKESGLKGKLLRPLSAKLLDETYAEKKKLIDRSKLLDIHGRSRKIQIELAKKYKIKYPNPAGGCLLCEKEVAKRLKNTLEINKKLDIKEIELLKLGRHFKINDSIIIVGRDEKENNKIIELADKKDILIEVKEIPSPVTIIIGKINEYILKKACELTIEYSDAAKMGKKKVEIVKIKK